MDLPGAFANLGDIKAGLHPQQSIHLNAERFFNPKRHIAGQVGFAVQQAGQGGAAHG